MKFPSALGLALALAAPAHLAAAPQVDFLPAAWTLKGCCYVTSVAVADLTGQGRPDVVTGNGFSYDITVLLADGAGGYLDPVTLPLTDPELGYVTVAVGDVTGDGKADIVAAGFHPNAVFLYAGDGHGGFAAPQAIGAGGGQRPRDAAIADLNGDGVPDLVSTNNASANVSVLLGDGAGGFLAPATFAAGEHPDGLAIGDATGDGHPDLAVVLADTATLVLLAGDGAGGFAAPVPLSIGDGARLRDVAIADVNGDGRADLVSANAGDDGSPFPPIELPGSVTILLADGQGGFAPPQRLAAGDGDGRADAVAVADVTGDGHADIVVSRPIANRVAVLAGDGAGGFAEAVVAPTGTGPSPLAIADLTGDGRLDVLVANQVGSNLSVLPGNASGGIGFGRRHAAGGYPHAIAAADFDHDGRPDVVTANLNSSDVSVLLGNGDGGFAAQTRIAVGNSPTGVASGDLNGDGHPDIVSADLGGGTVSVLLGDGSGGFGAATQFPVSDAWESPYALALGDADGDGHLDVATANTSFSTESISLLLGDGAGGFGPATLLPVGAGEYMSPQGIVMTDVTGDGHADIVTANLGSSDLSLLAGDGSGGFAPALSLPTDFGPVVVAAGDVNGDGVADLVTVNQSSQTASVLLGDGEGGFGAAASYAIHPPEDVMEYGPWPWGMTLADVTGDGRLDIVTANTQNNTASVLPNDGDGGFGSFHVFGTGALPGAVAAIDVDGDGDLDIVTANRENNDVAVLRNEYDASAIFADGFEP